MTRRRFTLEYWVDESWYVGRLREAPGVFSQGKTLDELEENIQEVYELMRAGQPTTSHADALVKEMEIDV